MPRYKRKPENRPFPKGWVKKHGAIYFRVPADVREQWDDKSWFRLGETTTEAYRTWAMRLGRTDRAVVTMQQLFDFYLSDVVPSKSPRTQESNIASIFRLRQTFDVHHLEDVIPTMAYKYRARIGAKHGLNSAVKDISLLTHALTIAVENGFIDSNPLQGQVKSVKFQPRDRLVEDWEINELFGVTIPNNKRTKRNITLLLLYIKLKLMTGLRRIDILTLKRDQIRADGIHVQPSKTQKTTAMRLIIQWDELGEMRKVIDDITALTSDASEFLFTTAAGQPFCDENCSCDQFDTIWHRFMKHLLETTKIKERFQERDLRAKVASESDSLQEASDRLGHAGTAVTKRVYRRKPVTVAPLIRDYKG